MPVLHKILFAVEKNLAECYVKLGKYDEAITCFVQVICEMNSTGRQ